MLNKDVIEYIMQHVNNHVNSNGAEFMAEKMVKNGYGQNVGGYFDVFKKIINQTIAEPHQKIHFISYYKDKQEKKPTYANLHCPQLLLWIAEISGLNKSYSGDAYDYLIAFENSYGIKDSKKGGNYLSKYQDQNNTIEYHFKKKLHIYEINKIIIQADQWNQVLDQVSQL